MTECPRCRNTEKTSGGDCWYCAWKGDAGPGAELREIIANDRKNKEGKTKAKV
jgi:hypothetical protein